MTLGHSPWSQSNEPEQGLAKRGSHACSRRRRWCWNSSCAKMTLRGESPLPAPAEREKGVLIRRQKARCWRARNTANVSSLEGMRRCHLCDFSVALTTILQRFLFFTAKKKERKKENCILFHQMLLVSSHLGPPWRSLASSSLLHQQLPSALWISFLGLL